MDTATVRIPRDRWDILKSISNTERKGMKDMLTEVIDDYIERHNETQNLLSKPGWAAAIKQGKREVEEGIKGKSLDELED